MPTEPPPFTREAPSPRYRELLELYRILHLTGEPGRGLSAERTFDGRSLAPHAGQIRALIARFGARSLLDYGAGKGGLYRMTNVRDENGQTYPDLGAFWNLREITLYDPAYPPYSAYPTGTFDAVICTDVLEHVPEEDLPWLVGELFAFADKFVFANVAAYPAGKHLPNGENAHCTIKPPEWWNGLFTRAASHAASRKVAPVQWFLLHVGDIDSTAKRRRATWLQG